MLSYEGNESYTLYILLSQNNKYFMISNKRRNFQATISKEFELLFILKVQT